MTTQKSTGLTKSQPKVQLTALIKDLGLAAKADNLNTLLNTPAPKNWFKTNNGIEYLPIDRVKNNLITIFQDYDWEITESKILGDSIVITGNLYVINPVTGRTRKLSGIGAWPIQFKGGTDKNNFSNIVHGAIQKNAPAAESLALKNAASKLGKLFGGGSDEIEFAPAYSKEVPIDQIKQGLADAD